MKSLYSDFMGVSNQLTMNNRELRSPNGDEGAEGTIRFEGCAAMRGTFWRSGGSFLVSGWMKMILWEFLRRRWRSEGCVERGGEVVLNNTPARDRSSHPEKSSDSGGEITRRRPVDLLLVLLFREV